MPVSFSFKVDPDAKLVQQRFQNLRADIPRIGKDVIYAAAEKAQKELNKPAKQPKAPGLWDSEKQRLAYFRSGGFGKGIPYTPTGKSARSWKISLLKAGARLYSTFKAAMYLWGDSDGENQSIIHDYRRPLFKTVITKQVEKLPKTIQQHLDGAIKKNNL